MIGRISGRIIERVQGHLLVDLNGIGYEVEVPWSTYARILDVDAITLHTHLVVREDAHLLYGFLTKTERSLFRALLKVNRVGPKLALTILSGIEVDALVACIRTNDTKTLAGVPGVGKKTAERMILDLRDGLKDVAPGGKVVPINTPAGNLADAESALVGLGFKPQEAALALSRIENPKADVETLIKQALKALA